MDGLFLPFVLSLLLTLTATEVSSLMWRSNNAQAGSYGTESSFGQHGGYGGYRGDLGQAGGWGGGSTSWGQGGGSTNWGQGGGSANWGQGGGSANWGQVGHNKGWNTRQCYDSRQCRKGECCRNRGYGGQCEYAGYYGCNDGWTKPVYPPNHKGGGQPPINKGRGGFCPPQNQWQNQWQNRGPVQLCRHDGDCPYLRKCCLSHKNRICMDPVFVSPGRQ